ncbi:MAG: 16S rRNA processing protein RimM [Chitinophagaceae bacterium]|nr:16S rRNA processing protein RimM [Chitinophagaceae bacterium]HMN33679.1 ribosome maturation factor RimM [Chitinophagaceae bacterium]
MKKIGKIVSVHGIHGDVVLEHQIINIDKVKMPDAFLIEMWKQSYIPFFIQSISISKNELVIRFEEIHSREEAKHILHKNVYTIDDKIEIFEGAEQWSHLIGMTLVENGSNHKLGEIVDVVASGIQYFLEVNYQQRLIHIPIHQQLVQKIDKHQGLIVLNIADGLLDIL